MMSKVKLNFTHVYKSLEANRNGWLQVAFKGKKGRQLTLDSMEENIEWYHSTYIHLPWHKRFKLSLTVPHKSYRRWVGMQSCVLAHEAFKQSANGTIRPDALEDLCSELRSINQDHGLGFRLWQRMLKPRLHKSLKRLEVWGEKLAVNGALTPSADEVHAYSENLLQGFAAKIKDPLWLKLPDRWAKKPGFINFFPTDSYLCCTTAFFHFTFVDYAHLSHGWQYWGNRDITSGKMYQERLLLERFLLQYIISDSLNILTLGEGEENRSQERFTERLEEIFHQGLLLGEGRDDDVWKLYHKALVILEKIAAFAAADTSTYFVQGLQQALENIRNAFEYQCVEQDIVHISCQSSPLIELEKLYNEFLPILDDYSGRIPYEDAPTMLDDEAEIKKALHTKLFEISESMEEGMRSFDVCNTRRDLENYPKQMGKIIQKIDVYLQKVKQELQIKINAEGKDEVEVIQLQNMEEFLAVKDVDALIFGRGMGNRYVICSEVRQKCRQKSASLHPDKHPNLSPEQREHMRERFVAFGHLYDSIKPALQEGSSRVFTCSLEDLITNKVTTPQSAGRYNDSASYESFFEDELDDSMSVIVDIDSSCEQSEQAISQSSDELSTELSANDVLEEELKILKTLIRQTTQSTQDEKEIIFDILEASASSVDINSSESSDNQIISDLYRRIRNAAARHPKLLSILNIIISTRPEISEPEPEPELKPEVDSSSAESEEERPLSMFQTQDNRLDCLKLVRPSHWKPLDMN